MIKVEGQIVTAEELTIVQRIKAFIAYQSTKALALFGAIYAGWALIPEEVKTELFDGIPYIRKLMALIYLVPMIYAFYKTRMTTQVVEIKPVAPTDPPK